MEMASSDAAAVPVVFIRTMLCRCRLFSCYRMGGDMRRRWSYLLLSACLAIAVASGSTTAAWAWSAELPNPMDFGVVYEKIAFEAADNDGNNLVSEGEFARDAAAAFSGLDRNHYGKLTAEELGSPDPSKFARIDTNGDGFFTFTEVMTFKMKAFKAADKSGDRKLSYEEMVESVKAE
jgi:EF hand